MVKRKKLNRDRNAQVPIAIGSDATKDEQEQNVD
jgi:hypothetical protein